VNIVRLLIISLFPVLLYGQKWDDRFWAYVGYFENKTDEEYRVFRSCNTDVALASDRQWEPLLRLLPNAAKDKPLNSTAKGEEILIKDPLLIGCLIKIEPADPASKKTTFYIRNGIQASGSCVYDWLLGPYDIEVSPVDFLTIEKDKRNEDITKIRYCGYRKSVLGLIIDNDAIQIIPREHALVVDKQKYPINGDNPGENEEQGDEEPENEEQIKEPTCAKEEQ